MTEKAKALLAMFEQVKAEQAADPEKAERERLERKKEAAEEAEKIKHFLEALKKNPTLADDLSDVGTYDEIIAELEELLELYTLLAKPIPTLEEDIERLRQDAEANPDNYKWLTAEELAAELAEEKAQTVKVNKEAVEVLSEGRTAAAEELLASVMLADFEAVGVTLTDEEQRAILSGNKKEALNVVYGVDFIKLLKLWQLLSERDSAQPGGGLQLMPYTNRPPEKTAISNSLVANKLIAIEEASRTGKAASVSPDKGGKGAFKVVTSLRYDDKNVSITGRPLTAFDKTVHNAIASIYAAGNPYFTLQMAYRAMNGLEVEQISPETLAPIRQSIEAGITRRLKIDATEQVDAYYKKRVKKAVYENYFLPLKKITVTMNNGEELEGYAFLDVPPLYEYSRSLNQVISVDIGLLATGKQLRNTPEVATIREYLIRRIEGMKNQRSSLNNYNIKYATILAEVGIDSASLSRTQLNRKRDTVKKILDHFKSKGFIVDYKDYYSGRSIEGVEIILK